MKNVSGQLQGFSTVGQASQALREELRLCPEPALTTSDVDNILRRVATKAQVEEYLQSPSSSYSRTFGRWNFIPRKEGVELDEKDIYDPLVALINNILKHFGLYDSDTRRVFNTSKIRLNHSNGTDNIKLPGEAKTLKTSPDLFAMLRDGVYFPEPDHSGPATIHPQDIKRVLNYGVCASPIEVKADKNRDGAEHLRDQCGMYARECFIQQPGRYFVFVPIFTESRVRLYRFDRGGALVGPWINYNDHPEVLVRIVLLTCGKSGERLGANPSIKWDGPKRYITFKNEGLGSEAKESGEKLKPLKYEIVKPLFVGKSIRGRGTCAWRVNDANGKPCVIKFLWRAVGRTAEWKLLERLRKMPGVVNILARSGEIHLFDTRYFKPATPFAGHDRVGCFIVLDCYGPNITEFRSPLQFLECFHDAIQGHQDMWNRGILHRDISINNILHGPEGAAEGARGVIIDMDLAIFFDRTESLCKADWLTGTHAFQSYHVLESGQPLGPDQVVPDFVPVHDYLDDLESFFWVFCWVCIGYAVTPGLGPSIELKVLPPALDQFQAVATVASGIKNKRLEFPQNLHLHPSWPHQFDTLKTQMAHFLKYYLKVKSVPPMEDPTRESLAVASECHYKVFLGYIKEAIDSLKSDGPPRDDRTLLYNFFKDEEEIAQKKAARISSPEVSLTNSDPTPVTPPRTASNLTTDFLNADILGSSPLSSLSSDEEDGVLEHWQQPLATSEYVTAPLPVTPPRRTPNPFGSSPLSSISSDEGDVLPALQQASAIHRSPLYGNHLIQGSPSPLTPSQVPNLNLTPQRRAKRTLDNDDTPTKRFRTPTGSIHSPFHSAPNTPRA